MNVVSLELEVLAKRGRGRDELERRAGRIESESRSIDQRLALVLAATIRVVVRRERIAATGQEIAGVGVDHHGSGVPGRRARGVLREDARHRRLKRRVDREPDVARAGQERLHVGMIGRVPVPKKRDQLAIVSPKRGDRLPGGIGQPDRRGVIVEPAKVVLRVALDVRRVGCRPIAAIPGVTQEMKASLAQAGSTVPGEVSRSRRLRRRLFCTRRVPGSRVPRHWSPAAALVRSNTVPRGIVASTSLIRGLYWNRR